MKILSFLKGLFGFSKPETLVVKSKPVMTEAKAVVKAEVKAVVAPKVEETKVIENRLAEVAEKKEELKVTAKEIKAKVKKDPQSEKVVKPAKVAKPVTEKKPVVKKKP